MELDVGAIVAGKVTGITKFGAFIMTEPGKQGLVHISEIAGVYVSDVRDHLTEGQDVMVKVIGLDQSGRLNLSIKAAAAPSEDRRRMQRQRQTPAAESSEPSFEDKLKRFMHDSDSKISGIKQFTEKKGARRRGR
jgi:S1 RNA binding domain protein